MTPKEHQRLLGRFWAKFRTAHKHKRTRLLQELAALPTIVESGKPRRQFERMKRSGKLMKGGACGLCGLYRALQHHIIPLRCGGINVRLNVIDLCEACHEIVHGPPIDPLPATVQAYRAASNDPAKETT